MKKAMTNNTVNKNNHPRDRPEKADTTTKNNESCKTTQNGGKLMKQCNSAEQIDFQETLVKRSLNNYAPEAIHLGAEEVFKALEAFMQEYNYKAPDFRNNIQIFIHKDTKEICAVWEYGRYFLESHELLNEGFIPIGPRYVGSPEDLVNLASDALYEYELLEKTMRRKKRIPLLIVAKRAGAYISTEYTVFSPRENRFLTLSDFEVNSSEYFVSDGDTNETPESTAKKYVVVTPSKEAIAALGLDLNPFEWLRSVPHTKLDLPQLDETKFVYDDAVDFLNKLKTGSHYGFTDEIWSVLDRLEQRLTRLEHGSILKAPAYVIQGELVLIQEAYDNAKSLFKNICAERLLEFIFD